MKHLIFTSFLIALLLFSCQNSNNNKPLVTKLAEKDNFKETMVESQFFSVDLSKDNTIESQKGNVIVVPEGSFLDKNGKVVKDDIQLEFAEATELDEMILSNLFVQEAKKMVKNHLSFYLNASRKGEQLKINPDNPVYIEVPAEKKIELFKTSRDENGNMQIGKKLEPMKFLTPVPLERLDFLPPGFELEVEKGLPFRGHTKLTKDLVDSLYYSFSGAFISLNIVPTIPSISDSLSTSDISLLDSLKITEKEALNTQDPDTTSTEKSCGINPASIKAIKTKKFENTLIATREFETRLKTIFATCNSSVLELYINNLDKNLWKIDEKAANLLGSGHNLYEKFMEFASLKQTKVELSNKRAQFLATQYIKQREKIEKEIRKLRQESIEKRRKKDKIAQKKRKEYSELLRKRLKYRMDKFGFELTEVGWYNAAEVITLDDLDTFELNVTVKNGNQYDRVYTYVINPKVKSIFSLLSDDNVHFDKVFAEDPHLLLWKNQKFKTLAVGYENEKIAYKIVEYEQSPIINAEIQLENRTVSDFKKELKEFTRLYKRENKISVDLEYQEFFNKEKERKMKEMEEDIFMFKLRKHVFNCCNPIYNGNLYFNNTKMNKVFKTLSDIYGVTFIAEDKALLEKTFDVTFENVALQNILEIISVAFVLKYSYENDTYTFY